MSVIVSDAHASRMLTALNGPGALGSAAREVGVVGEAAEAAHARETLALSLGGGEGGEAVGYHVLVVRVAWDSHDLRGRGRLPPPPGGRGGPPPAAKPGLVVGEEAKPGKGTGAGWSVLKSMLLSAYASQARITLTGYGGGGCGCSCGCSSCSGCSGRGGCGGRDSTYYS